MNVMYELLLCNVYSIYVMSYIHVYMVNLLYFLILYMLNTLCNTYDYMYNHVNILLLSILHYILSNQYLSSYGLKIQN